MTRFYSIILFLLCAGSAYNSSAQKRKSFVQTNKTVLLDGAGKELILHGLNLVNKDYKAGYRGGFNLADFDSMKTWGYNTVRLGISWAALEPEPGKIDSTYLYYLDTCIQWAAKAGIYVLLDMHQDLYSYKYEGGNGAPLWACLDEGKPNLSQGTVWSDAYNTNEALQTAFDNFWKNAKAPDAVGVQDHLANVWQTVAKRYAANPVVMGYDLLNEPFIGSRVKVMGELFYKGFISSPVTDSSLRFKNAGEFMQYWMQPEGRQKLTQLMNDTVLYKRIIDATEPEYAAFEKKGLMPFYQRMITAIRKVDTNHLFFLEPSVSANTGIISHLKNLIPGKMVFAPHAYDIVLDTDIPGAFSKERLQLIFARHHAMRQRLGAPLVIGEWGAFYGSNKVNAHAAYITQLLNGLRCGDIFWHYGKELSNQSYFRLIQRKKD